MQIELNIYTVIYYRFLKALKLSNTVLPWALLTQMFLVIDNFLL